MRLPCTIAAAAVLLFCAAVDASADRDSADPGAGPIPGRISPCLIAYRQHRDSDCPEPKVVDQASSIAEQVGNRLARVSYFIEIEELEKALAEVDLVLAVDSNNARAHHLAARLSMSMALSDGERAQREAVVALKLAPDDPAVRTTYAIALEARQAKSEALKELNAVVKAHPDYLFAHEQRALLLLCCGFAGGALGEYNYLIDRSKPSATLFASRAQAFIAAHLPKDAVADLSAAIKLDPDSPELLSARANAYTLAELDEFAVKDYDTLLTISDGTPRYPMGESDRANLMAMRAQAFVRLHRFDDAANDMVAALNIGGTRAVLRVQVFLRGNGFPDVPLDGRDSPALRHAIASCFGLNACFQGVIKSI